LPRSPAPLHGLRRSRRSADLTAVYDLVTQGRYAEAESRARALLVPDGDRHLLNFATLPVGQDGYLLETGPALQHSSAERDVLAVTTGPRDEAGASPAGGLLAFGGLNFGHRPGPDMTGGSRAGLRAPDYAGLRALTIRPLPGSRAEVEEIGTLWTGSAGSLSPGIPARGGALILTGRQRDEGEFKRRAPGRRVLHLATHGFFLDDVCRVARTGGGDRSAAGPDASERAFPVFGLALAGANRRPIVDGGAGVMTHPYFWGTFVAAGDWK